MTRIKCLLFFCIHILSLRPEILYSVVDSRRFAKVRNAKTAAYVIIAISKRILDDKEERQGKRWGERGLDGMSLNAKSALHS
jgi:hypothetical protein